MGSEGGLVIAERVARFGAIAGALGVDVGGVAQAMPLLGDAPAHVEIGFRADGGALAFACDAPREPDWIARVGRLAQLIGADPAPVPRLAGARTARVVRLELASTPRPAGVAATVRWLGDGVLGEDLDALVLAAIPDAVRFALSDRATFLADATAAQVVTTGLALRLSLGEDTQLELAQRLAGDEPSVNAAMGRMLALLRELGTSDPQRTLFERIHPVLAVNGPALVAVRATAHGAAPTLTVTWDGARWNTRGWDTALRVVTGLHPKDTDAARRVGTIEGALGASTVTSIAIDFGPTDPPVGWIWAAPT